MGFEKSTEAIREGWPLFIIGGIGEIGVIKMTLILTMGLVSAGGIMVAAYAQASAQASAQTQSNVCKGVVYDSTGEPLIGATVMVKGTTNGTSTDIDGAFSLSNVKKGATLLFSYVGMDPKEVKWDGQAIEVTLSDNESVLNELVVVGYGVQRKSDVTGSVTSVSKDRLTKLPVSNVLQAMQGATSGVTIQQSSSIPGDAPSTIVRGQNSINANSGPYVVVDGIPLNNTGGSLSDIAPNDIESIEILKDASATAIYGTNGANGVILVTTKRGKEGRAKVTYSGYVGIEDFAKKLQFCDGDQIIQRYKDYVAQNPGETMFNENVKYQNDVDNYNAGRQTDWLYDVASRTGVIQDHNVTVSGGSENAKYFVSLDYYDQKGILKGYDYKRYSIRTNLDVDVTKWLQFGTNIFIASHNRDGGRVNLLNAEAMSPWGKVYEDDGSLCIYPMYSEQLWSNPLLGTKRDDERRAWNISINGYGVLDFGNMWAPLKGLQYRLNFGYSFSPTRNSWYTGRETNDQNGTGEIKNADTQTRLVENLIYYNRDFGKHRLGVTLLAAAMRKKYSENTAHATKFVNDNLSYNNLGAGETPSVKSYADLRTTSSLMGRINYSFDSRYLFTFTVRRDGSSVFGDNNKYGTFPSVAVGWNISNEKFMEPSNSWLNNLKLRLSYGKAGNEAISVYETILKLSVEKFAMGGNSVVGLIPSTRMANKDLGWEETKTFNVGVDFGFLNNRLNGNIDFYTSITDGLLLLRRLPNLSGYSDVYANMGKTANHGIELTLNSRNIVTKDFTWSSGLVFSWNHNEIKDLYGDKTDDVGNRWFIGHPIGVIYDYEMVGIWQKDEIERGEHLNWDPVAEPGDVKLADRNGDGVINDDDRYVQGQTTPKWNGGLTNTFTYKGFTLSVFLNTVQGHKNWNRLLSVAGDEMGRRNQTTEIGYWTEENCSNEFRSLSKSSNKHNYGYAQDAWFWRIKDVTLSYTFPEKWMSKIGIDNLMLYVSARNLVTWTNWTGWDPETQQDPRGSGSWESNYPYTRTYTFGLNVTF